MNQSFESLKNALKGHRDVASEVAILARHHQDILVHLLSDLPYAQACEWIEAAKTVLHEQPDTVAEEKRIADHSSIGEDEVFTKVNLEVSGKCMVSISMSPLSGR